MYPRTESGEDEDSGWRPLAVTQTGAGRQADDWGDGQYSNFNSSQGGIEIGVAWMVATSESADCFSQTAEIILPPQFPNDPPVLK